MLSDFAKKMMRVIGIIFAILVAASVAYYRSPAFLPFALGALIGVATSIGKVILLDRAVASVVRMDKDRSKNYLLLQHFLRYLLTGVALVISALAPFINIWGTAAGVLSLQVAVFFGRQTQNVSETTTTEQGEG